MEKHSTLKQFILMLSSYVFMYLMTSCEREVTKLHLT